MTEIVTPVPITPMPAAPLLTDTQSVFNTKAFAFVAAWDAFVAQMNASAAATRTNAVAGDERAVSANTSSVSAANSAAAAGSARDMAQAFAQSAINAPGSSGTSASLVAISAGAKSLGTQAGKSWVPGQAVVVADATNPVGLRMYGIITSYDASSGVLAFDVPPGAFVGSGSSNSWVISLTATREGLVRLGAGPNQLTNPLSLGLQPGGGFIRISVDGVDLGPIVLEGHHDLAPPGMFGLFFMAAIPSGWLKANGAAVSRTTYARLFSRIGTYYGSGDGSTTFNVPDIRGVFARAWDDGRGVDPGRALGSYQAPQNMSHNHTAWSESAGGHSHGDWTYGAGSHTHGVNDPGHSHSVAKYWGRSGPQDRISSGEDTPQGTQQTSASGTGIWLSADGYHIHQIAGDGWHTHAIGVGYEGGGESRPHSVALAGCIKY